MTNELIDLVFKDSFTSTEALRRLRLFKEHLESKLFGGTQTQDQSLSLPTSEREKLWLKTAATTLANQFTRDNINEAFNEAEKAVREIQPLVIFLPFDLPEEGILQLGEYLRQSFGPRFLMEVRLDPYLIAGAAFSLNGIYKDYSMRQKIIDNHQIILKALGEYRSN